MQVIQHRYNDPVSTNLQARLVEIDVHVAENSSLVVKHDPDGQVRYRADYIAGLDDIDGFFVDIKQSLSVKDLKRIAATFGDKLMGLFDIPFPSAYFARKAGLPVYGRLSEFEPINRLFDRFWLDPLTSWNTKRYLELFSAIDMNHKVIVAAPSLHGHSAGTDIRIARALRDVDSLGQIEGFVTKHPVAVEEALNA